MPLSEEEKKKLMGGPMYATRRGGCLNVFIVLLVLASVLIAL